MVLTVPTLAGEPIEEFALRVAETWGIGHAGLDNGIVVVVAPDDRQARIEVGYGLEGVVPDAIAKRVLEDVMFSHFRSGDLAGGIEAGVDALMKAARGERIPATRRPRADEGPSADPATLVVWTSVLAFLVAAPFRRRRVQGAVAAGAVSGVVTYVVLRVLAWAGVAFALGALVGWFATSPGTLRRGLGRSGSGWDGGWSGGGGGFGGGGGGFGGGGASGRW